MQSKLVGTEIQLFDVKACRKVEGRVRACQDQIVRLDCEANVSCPGNAVEGMVSIGGEKGLMKSIVLSADEREMIVWTTELELSEQARTDSRYAVHNVQPRLKVDGDEFDVIFENVSRKGACIRTIESIPIQEKVKLACLRDGKVLELEFEVRWFKQPLQMNKKTYGLQLIEPDRTLVAGWDKFVLSQK